MKHLSRITNFNFHTLEERHPNEDVRTYHTKHLLVPINNRYSSEHGGDLTILKPSIKPVLMEMLTIRGVVCVSIHPYSFTITKATAYQWVEMRPQIILAMAKYLPAKY